MASEQLCFPDSGDMPQTLLCVVLHPRCSWLYSNDTDSRRITGGGGWGWPISRTLFPVLIRTKKASSGRDLLCAMAHTKHKQVPCFVKTWDYNEVHSRIFKMLLYQAHENEWYTSCIYFLSLFGLCCIWILFTKSKFAVLSWTYLPTKDKCL